MADELKKVQEELGFWHDNTHSYLVSIWKERNQWLFGGRLKSYFENFA